MSNQLAKPFECFTCKSTEKLQRKDDNSGWLKFNLDVIEHNCQKKKFSKQSQELSEVKTLLQQILSRLDQIEGQITPAK